MNFERRIFVGCLTSFIHVAILWHICLMIHKIAVMQTIHMHTVIGCLTIYLSYALEEINIGFKILVHHPFNSARTWREKTVLNA